MTLSIREQLLSRLCAAAQRRWQRAPCWNTLLRFVEEHLSEIKADGELFDCLRPSRNKFERLVTSVHARLNERS